MASIQDQLNIIKETIEKFGNDNIDEIINEIINTHKIHPLIMLYYQMNNNTIEFPKKYFDFIIKEGPELELLKQICDANFINYISDYTKKYKVSLLDGNIFYSHIIIEEFVKKNNVNNLLITWNTTKDKTYLPMLLSIIVSFIFKNNKHQVLLEFINNIDVNSLEEYYAFNDDFLIQIMESGDNLDFIRVYHQISNKFPDIIKFDFYRVIFASLINGHEKCMNYILDNFNVENKKEANLKTFNLDIHFDFYDIFVYAIIGKNINCIRTLFDKFKPSESNWEMYFKFAASFGTSETIKYMLIMKPNLAEQIDNFYNIILKFALANVNTDNIDFALNNGAVYSEDMEEFFKEFNEDRFVFGDNELYDFNDDINFNEKIYSLYEDFEENYKECMKKLKNY
jgi:hypothetical protein